MARRAPALPRWARVAATAVALDALGTALMAQIDPTLSARVLGIFFVANFAHLWLALAALAAGDAGACGTVCTVPVVSVMVLFAAMMLDAFLDRVTDLVSFEIVCAVLFLVVTLGGTRNLWTSGEDALISAGVAAGMLGSLQMLLGIMAEIARMELVYEALSLAVWAAGAVAFCRHVRSEERLERVAAAYHDRLVQQVLDEYGANFREFMEDAVATRSASAFSHAVHSVSERKIAVASQAVVRYTGDAVGGETACPICCDDYAEGDMLRSLACGHAFHLKCADEWLLNHSLFCPMCRARVTKLPTVHV